MELEQLISTAKERLGQTNASDRTIENFFKNPAFLPGEGVEPDEAYWTRTVATLKWYSDNYKGQHDHDMSTAHAAWEEQWKKDHPDTIVPTAQPQTPPAASQNGMTTEEVSRLIAEAIAKTKSEADKKNEEFVELQKQFKAMQDAKVEEENRQKVAGIYAAAKSKILAVHSGADQNMLEDAIEHLQLKGSITKDTSEEDAEKAIRARYEYMYKRHNPGGQTPYGITSAGGNDGKTFAQRWMEERQKAEADRQKTVESQRQRFK